MYLKWFLVTDLAMMRHLNTLMMFTRSYIVTVSIVVMTLLGVVSHSLANFVVDRLTVTLVHIMTLNQNNDIDCFNFIPFSPQFYSDDPGLCMSELHILAHLSCILVRVCVCAHGRTLQTPYSTKPFNSKCSIDLWHHKLFGLDFPRDMHA